MSDSAIQISGLCIACFGAYLVTRGLMYLGAVFCIAGCGMVIYT